MLVFLTFASSNMSYKRIKNEAIESKLFDKVIAYDEHDLPEDFQQIMKDRISEYGMKGYAYWSWKPYIIKQTLEEMNDGDILLYMDAGSTLNINNDSIGNFNNFINQSIENKLGYYRTIGITKYYSTRKLISAVENYYDYSFKDEELMVKEIQASTIILPKNKTSADIVNDWNHIAQNNFDTITDVYNNEDNGDGFIRNQHDQSLLSLILIKYNIPSIDGIKSWTSGDWNTLNHMPFLDTRKRYN